MAMMIDGGGGRALSSWSRDDAGPTRKRRTRIRVRTVETEICRRLGLPYYGFLLYHSGHHRLRTFLETHLTFLDHVTGSRFGIFILLREHGHPLKLDAILASRLIDDELKLEIREWRKRSRPFTPDQCLEIAEALSIPKGDLPTLILFRSANGYRAFARLNLKDSWFPANLENKQSVHETMSWLSSLFDSLEKSMEKRTKKTALAEFQKRMDKLARSQMLYRPIFEGLKSAVVPIIRLPFDLVASLSSIVKNVGTKMVEQKVKAALGAET
jgi:hypothetical protein